MFFNRLEDKQIVYWSKSPWLLLGVAYDDYRRTILYGLIKEDAYSHWQSYPRQKEWESIVKWEYADECELCLTF